MVKRTEKSKEAPLKCNCVALLEARLKSQETYKSVVLDKVYDLRSGTAYLPIKFHYKGKRDAPRTGTVVPTYCALCGTKL